MTKIDIVSGFLGAGKTKKRKRNSDDLEWIDRLEELDAIFDDD